jgi:hypothetical protein
METVATFLNNFEPLSGENARKFVGLTHDAAFKIYETTHGTIQKSSVFKSAWGQLVRRKFGNEILSRNRSHGCTSTIRYCKLQPKDPGLWTYLLSRSSGTKSASLSIDQNSVAINEATVSIDQGTFVSCPLDSINEEAFTSIERIEANQDSPQVQGSSIASSDPIESSSKQKRYLNVDPEDNKGIDREDEGPARPYADEVYFFEEETTSDGGLDDTSRKRAKPEPLFMDLPDLNSKRMRKYAKQQLKNAPSWIRNWLEANGFAAGLNLDGYQPHFITANIRKELQENGFAVIKGVFDLDLLKEAARYVQIKQNSERIHESSYKDLCRRRFAVGLVTKNGWTKTDYAGYAQQVINGGTQRMLFIIC